VVVANGFVAAMPHSIFFRCWPVRVDDSNEDGLCSPVRAAARMAFHMDARMAFHVPTVLPFSVAMSDAATSATNVDAATSAIDVHMLVPVTPKYKSSLPLSVSLHIINQREHVHCILISDQ
jgi:hypothetical protein